MIITLTGMMGCGKSSVGRELSELLSLPFVDLDGYIEKLDGRNIRDIFAAEGERAFRETELKALKEILKGDDLQCGPGDGSPEESREEFRNRPGDANMVLALGGGTLTSPECAELVAEHTFCIYLKASADTLFSRLENEAAGRPMLNPALSGPEEGQPCQNGTGPTPPESGELLRRITELLLERAPAYEKAASLAVETDGLTVKQVADAVRTSFRVRIQECPSGQTGAHA